MSKSKNVIAVDDSNFDKEVLRSEVPVLVDFGATWCGPCRALAPIIDTIADEQVGKLKVVTLDIDAAPNTTTRYGVRSAPTVILFARGEKKAQHVGLTTKEKLVKLLEASR